MRNSSLPLLALLILPAGCMSATADAPASTEAPVSSIATCRMSAAPSTIDLGGEVSAIAVGDVDGDGCRDIAAYVVEEDEDRLFTLSVVVAFGDEDGRFDRRWSRKLAEKQGASGLPPAFTTRDESDDLVAIEDVDGDGRLDLLTAAGIARGTIAGLEWSDLPAPEGSLLSPVRLVDLDGTGQPVIVRGTHAGEVERCAVSGACETLARAGTAAVPVTDIVVGDFDHDGKPDLLVGRHYEEDLDADFFVTYRTWLYGSRDGHAAPKAIEGMHSVDLEVADLDGDGFPDVASQVRETISDFPSQSELWISHPAGFTKAAVVPNHDNHQDKAKLADIDGDGCVDYLKIGVDVGAAVHWGVCNGGLVTYDRAILLPGESAKGYGVQFLDVDGDGNGEIVVRGFTDPEERFVLRLFPVPPKP